MSLVEKDLVEWFATDAGRRVAAAERGIVESRIRRFHGDELLWLGPSMGLATVTFRCLVRDRFIGAQMAPEKSSEADHPVVMDYFALPFPSSRADGVVLHHALDLSRDRRATLREATRVLRQGGRILIVGFNPFSATSINKLRRPFRMMRSLSIPRLKEWLSVLGFEVSRPTYFAYRGVLPLDWQSRWLDEARSRLGDWNLPFGGVYVVTATKVAFGTIGPQRRYRVESQRLDTVVVHPAAVRSRESP